MLADLARSMHEAGVHHRDFYLCHVHAHLASDCVTRLSLIDLHRALLRRRLPPRYLVKALGALYFSAMDCGVSERDLLRFQRHYCPGGLRQALGPHLRFWERVRARAAQLYAREKGRQRTEAGVPVPGGETR